MDTALGWIGQIASWFGSLIPTWRLVRANYGGVKYLRGGRTKVIGPGIHWFWPATTEMVRYPTNRQVLDSSPQTLMTKDGVSVYVSGIAIFTVVDLHKFLVDNYEAEESAEDFVQTAIRKTICSRRFEDIQKDRHLVDDLLTVDVQRVLTSLGIKVEAARLTDFSKARVTNLVGSGLVNIESQI